MPAKNPYEILGIQPSASKEEIKRAYKEIALACHPDKLTHITDEAEKNARIEKFKIATQAYDVITQGVASSMYGMGFDAGDDGGMSFDGMEAFFGAKDGMFKNIWSSLFDDDVSVKDILIDVAKQFIVNKMYAGKSSESLSQSSNDSCDDDEDDDGDQGYDNSDEDRDEGGDDEAIVHNVSLHVTYAEILNNTKKKIRLILVNIDEPVFVEVYAGSYPQDVKEYIDKYNIPHEIIVNIEIKKDKDYDHIVLKSGAIDLIRHIDLTIGEYIMGAVKEIAYIDGQLMQVHIPAFKKKYHDMPGKGIMGGSLIFDISVKHIEQDDWEFLCEKDKLEMIRILKTLQK
jgi:DnaJ-class molecular chaperone